MVSKQKVTYIFGICVIFTKILPQKSLERTENVYNKRFRNWQKHFKEDSSTFNTVYE